MYLPAFTQADLPSLLNLPTVIACSTATRHRSIHPVQFACALKGGLLSIATQELLLALLPSPPGLDHGMRPGIPAVAELAQGPRPEDIEHEGEHGRGGDLYGSDLATLR